MVSKKNVLWGLFEKKKKMSRLPTQKTVRKEVFFRIKTYYQTWAWTAILFACVFACLYTIQPQKVLADDTYMADIIDEYTSLNKNTVTTTQNADGSWKIQKTQKGAFKVLQLTDIHLRASDEYYGKNIKAMDTVYELIKREQPDLLEVTGDLVFAMSYTSDEVNEETFRMCIRFFDKIGISWIWTFGNHDHDFFDRYTPTQVHTMLKQSSTLLQYRMDNSVDGYTNGEFRLYNADDTLNRILISIDSHDMLPGGGYDYIRDSQVTWYTNIVNKDKHLFGNAVQTFVYTHIPPIEYREAWSLYENSDACVTYQFGVKGEDIGCSDICSKLGETMARLGSTKAIFCGHDHLNNYAITYNGITYVYGKSIDFAAYVGIENQIEQRGATMLMLSENGNDYVIRQIHAADLHLEWKNGILRNVAYTGTG